MAYSAPAIVTLSPRRFVSTTVEVSASGVLLVGEVDCGARAGDDIDLSFVLPPGRRMVHVDAQIVRIERTEGRQVWAVRLLDPPPDIVARIDEVAAMGGEVPDPGPRRAARTRSRPKHEVPAPPRASRPHHGEEVYAEVDAPVRAPRDPKIPDPLPE